MYELWNVITQCKLVGTPCRLSVEQDVRFITKFYTNKEFRGRICSQVKFEKIRITLILDSNSN